MRNWHRKHKRQRKANQKKRKLQLSRLTKKQ